MKKALALILSFVIAFSAMTVSGVCVFAQDASSETILLNTWECDDSGNYIYNEVPVTGEIVPGENTVTADGSCYRLTAAKTGYYGLSEDGYCWLDVLQKDEEERGKLVYSSAGVTYWCDTVIRNNGKSYNIIYIEEPGTFYVRFAADEANAADCVTDFVYFGELESFEASCNPLVMGSDIEMIWREDEGGTCCIKEVNLTFSGGETCVSTCYGRIDEWRPGARIFSDKISNGPEYTVQLNLVSVTEAIDRVELPNKYGTVLLTSFADSECFNLSDSEIEKLFWPECVDVYFKDGSVQRVEITEDDGDDCYSGTIASEDGKEHNIVLYYNRGNNCFNAYIDGIHFTDLPVYRSRLPFLDSLLYVARAVYFFTSSIKIMETGISPVQAISDYFDAMSQLTEGFINYNRDMYESGRYIPAIIATILSETSKLFG